MDEISEFMSGDHDRLDALLERYRAAGGADLDEFASLLTRHMDWEERLLFPALSRKAGLDSVPSIDTMRLQHEEFKRQIEGIRRCPSGDAALRRNLLEVLVESIADHNFAEEYYIYPWIDGALDPAEKTDILTAVKTEQGGHRHDAQNVA
ncbi:MAG: hemerythrin domain-containing protein [Elusimicrobia bacterium]|nr:hemerythrin domain-containing protein [Elusimicrobiota bacterium]